MGKNSRWMTWVLEESATTKVTMPWARGTRPDWKEKLATDTPELAQIVENGLHLARGSHQHAAH
ncbi:hypothetical protein C8N43_3176 [Litoreibacter ponti]|uniref:Uncharacterized protein n=1 Tax=Litoreibacter ponti TaxID=1510457 RepID=A0A2T6BE72_9RHOB|nr:hypothetical protein [Litoreibacter ponti]PTX54362.1 hypothetical protein C8N43_3176 [Litoreibacter ponti]